MQKFSQQQMLNNTKFVISLKLLANFSRMEFRFLRIPEKIISISILIENDLDCLSLLFGQKSNPPYWMEYIVLYFIAL